MPMENHKLFLKNPETGKKVENLRQQFDEKRLKWTRQREELAVWVFNYEGHFTADDIITSFRIHKSPMPTATVYRFIQSLLDLKVISEHNMGENSRCYEQIHGISHHDHLICRVCGRIDEFSDDRIEKLQEEIASANGYTLEKHTMNLYGVCPGCRNRH